MKYNRGDTNSAIEAAIFHARGYNRTLYIYPTFFGAKVDFHKPSGVDCFIEVLPEGTVYQVDKDPTTTPPTVTRRKLERKQG